MGSYHGLQDGVRMTDTPVSRSSGGVAVSGRASDRGGCCPADAGDAIRYGGISAGVVPGAQDRWKLVATPGYAGTLSDPGGDRTELKDQSGAHPERVRWP